MANGFDALASPSVPAVGGGEDRTGRAVLEVVEQLRTDFKERNLLYQRIEDVFHGRVPLKIPDAFKDVVTPVRSPLPLHHKNTIVAALSTNPQKVNVKPLGFGDTWETNASDREHFFDASWKLQELEAGRPLTRLAIDALVAKGEFVLKTVERTKRAWSGYGALSSKVLEDLMDDEWQRKSTDDRRKEYDRRTEDYKARAPYPIVTTDVLPETFYYLRSSEGGFSFCCEVKQVPYLDTLARFGYGVGRGGRIVPQAMGLPLSDWSKALDGRSTLTMVEAWTWKECHYVLLAEGQSLAEGTRVKTIRHGYGDPVTRTLRGPYFQALGQTSHERLPHRAGLSLLYPFLDLYVLHDAVRTMRAVNAHRTAYAAWMDATPPGGTLPGDAPFGRTGTEALSNVTITPGTILPGDIRPIEQPKAGVDFNLFAEELRRDLDLAVPSVLQGAVDTTESGWQLAQAVHLARLNWSPPIANAERAFSERTGFESWLIENRIRERVYARGEVEKGGKSKSGYLSVGPEDLDGLHDVYEVKLDPELPSTQVVELRYWGEAVDRGFASDADAISALGRNPDEVRRQRTLELYRKSDQVTKRIFERVDEILGQRKEAALQDAGFGPPGTAAPPPGAALAGMANPQVPGQAGMPLEPTPQVPGSPVPQAGGTPAGQPGGGVPAERMAYAQGIGGMG